MHYTHLFRSLIGLLFSLFWFKRTEFLLYWKILIYGFFSIFVTFFLKAEDQLLDSPNRVAYSASNPAKVYVIPVQEEIGEPNLYILRFAIKQAIDNDIDLLVLDMNTPGGRLDVTLEMMTLLDKFEGSTYTFINPDAISAGAYIAAATEKIFMSPKGTIGAAAVIQGTGQDVNETLKLKIDSYLKARVRNLSEERRYRADVVRAMMDEGFSLAIGEEVLKEEGELLTLTAKEAVALYGEPKEPLLADGIYDSVEDLLTDQYGKDQYEITAFTFNWAQQVAIFLKRLSTVLIGIGILGLFVEFKTPSFGIFGIGGLICLLVVFASNYVAGLAGAEPILFFALGIVLIGVELFVFPGLFISGLIGLLLLLGSLVWSLADIWPQSGGSFDWMVFTEPLIQILIGLLIALAGMLLLSRILPKTWVWEKLILSEAVGNNQPVKSYPMSQSITLLGKTGVALTPLLPSGRVTIEGKSYDATAPFSSIRKGDPIVVTEEQGFSLVVTKQKAG